MVNKKREGWVNVLWQQDAKLCSLTWCYFSITFYLCEIMRQLWMIILRLIEQKTRFGRLWNGWVLTLGAQYDPPAPRVFGIMKIQCVDLVLCWNVAGCVGWCMGTHVSWFMVDYLKNEFWEPMQVLGSCLWCPIWPSSAQSLWKMGSHLTAHQVLWNTPTSWKLVEIPHTSLLWCKMTKNWVVKTIYASKHLVWAPTMSAQPSEPKKTHFFCS